jgi:hypothetical protein
MNTKNYKLLFGALVLMVFTTFTSCDEVEDIDVGGTSVEDMSGDWYLEFNGSYYLMTTYNTAADNGQEMWIDDNQNFWWFKAKCPVNATSLTFAGSDLPSSYDGYDITVTITNGKIEKGTAVTSGGNKSDAISFDIEFSDDPGTIYSLAGYKRTGFAEDEH